MPSHGGNTGSNPVGDAKNINIWTSETGPYPVKYGMAVSGSRVGVLADPDRHDPQSLRRQKDLSGQRFSLVAHFGRDRFRQSRAPSTSDVTTR
jgi:hypothetical protein